LIKLFFFKKYGDLASLEQEVSAHFVVPGLLLLQQSNKLLLN
jgi:hypothetical protein